MALPILGEIERLINEHGSAVILKERLALAADQYAALEKKISELQTENERLRLDLQESEKQRQELREKLSHEGTPDYTMQWGCLKFEGDNQLYCPACFFKSERKIPTSRATSMARYCSVCKTAIPSR